MVKSSFFDVKTYEKLTFLSILGIDIRSWSIKQRTPASSQSNHTLWNQVHCGKQKKIDKYKGSKWSQVYIHVKYYKRLNVEWAMSNTIFLK